MSRSKRKHPFIGNMGGSEKKDKEAYNRGIRARERAALSKGDFDNLPKHEGSKHGGNWNFQKDGKHRFNKKKYPELMRK